MITKILAAVILFATVDFDASQAKKPNPDCTYEGKNLYGKVKFVESFPDLTVQFVTSSPDLKVQFVSAFADECGEWEVVESFPDLKVKIVAVNPDMKIQVVSSFPGVN